MVSKFRENLKVARSVVEMFRCPRKVFSFFYVVLDGSQRRVCFSFKHNAFLLVDIFYSSIFYSKVMRDRPEQKKHIFLSFSCVKRFCLKSLLLLNRFQLYINTFIIHFTHRVSFKIISFLLGVHHVTVKLITDSSFSNHCHM